MASNFLLLVNGSALKLLDKPDGLSFDKNIKNHFVFNFFSLCAKKNIFIFAPVMD